MPEFDIHQPDSFKARVRASFDKTPPTYGTNGDFHWQFAARLIQQAPIQVGQIVLDVATGTAPAAIMAAQRVGIKGHVIGLDLSPGILGIAQHQVKAAQITNLELLCGDAEHLPFAQGQFDGWLCSSAIVWFPDIPGALKECYCVLRASGWLAFSCFGGPARQVTGEIMSQLLQRHGQTIPELNGRLNTPDKCRQMVEEAGFTRVQITGTQTRRLFDTPEESYRQSEAGRARFGVKLTTQQEGQLKAAYIAELERILPKQDQWNHDYEQFVTAYKPS